MKKNPRNLTMKILLVDDEPDFLDTLCSSLSRYGHTITSANGGEKAWDIISSGEKFDVIISDIRMIPLDGIGLLEKVRESGNNVPILLMTGHGDLDLSIQAIKLGANDFILKPFPLHYLKSVLAKLQTDIISLDDRNKLVSDLSEEMHLAFPSDYTLVPSINSILHQQYLHNCDLNDVSAHLIDLCVNEAILNSVIHGNLEVDSALKEESWEKFQAQLDKRTSDKKYKERKVKVDFYQSPEEIRFVIEDQGKGFNHKKHLESLNSNDSDLISFGRGVALIHSIMDEVSWNESGTKITFIKYFNASEKSSTEGEEEQND